MRWRVGQRVAYQWKHAGEFLFGLGLAVLVALVVLLLVPSREKAPVAGIALVIVLALIAWYFKRAGDKLELEHSINIGSFAQDFVGPKGTLLDDDL
jgi:hypothetical protein